MDAQQQQPTDRRFDQDVWAECLDPAYTFSEGRLQLGEVFRVGWANQAPIITVPYPAVRMELLRSLGVAYRVAAPVQQPTVATLSMSGPAPTWGACGRPADECDANPCPDDLDSRSHQAQAADKAKARNKK